jgi:UV DNA damage repair endonuclease
MRTYCSLPCNVLGFLNCRRTLDITVEVEAKAKEAAVMRLMSDLRQAGNATLGRRRKSRYPAHG